MTWPFGDLRPLSYGLIMVDFPWRFSNWSAKGEVKNPLAHYECMTLAEMKALPIAQLAAPDCVLWMWATNPMLPQALDVMAGLGFTFKTAGHWVKRTPSGKLAFGTGYVLRSAGEPFLIGTIGKPTTSRSVRSIVEGPVREHSRKPDEAYVAAEALVPGTVRRADLFSREGRPGWDAWGREAGKFNQAA
ncbi:MT-A70 family methyltransferase [Xanthobacter tagetidis]|uniref:DNA methyltransferase n=1 Tax=Xanthobacter tagetidis TaxID=60216 RepID=A0A3L7AGD2_9HYPH|nr:MT-A70 family methyltransferase [Xanthobacter tagetidis]MBB6306248.1 N6-adenosine-specific RNA methylase IME4 [Xanthobacter tagetidis]RLP79526.1 DNA methyltransferase [Xanthobacter tagetidis]